MLELKAVKVNKPDDVNIIIGQAHFIKTVEDIYEALVSSVPGIQFGLAFAESSGATRVRSEGNHAELKKLAEENALGMGAGHSFIRSCRRPALAGFIYIFFSAAPGSAS